MHSARGPTNLEVRSSFSDLRAPRRLGIALTKLLDYSPRTFAALFTQGDRVAAHKIAGFQALTESGLVRHHEGRFRSLFRIFHHDGLFVLSDWKGSASDEVFRPWQAEVDLTAPFFLDGLVGSRVLDLGCGSGLYAIAAAASGASAVVAVDVSPRALEAALFGARLNGVAEHIELRRSDLFNDIGGQFDVILASLPYRPTPPGPPGKLYAEAGVAGMAHLERALRGAADHLSCTGQLRVCCMALSDGRQTIVERLATTILGNDPAWMVSVDRVGKAIQFREWWRDNGDPTLAADDWLASLERDGLTHFQRVRLQARYAKAG